MMVRLLRGALSPWALALLALVAARHRRRLLVAGLAAATSLASPVAGAFLALCGAALIVTRGRERSWRSTAWLLLLPPLATVAIVERAFPDTGTYPFPWWVFVPSVVLVVGAIVLGLR